jgi:hypothetical protein
MNQDLQVLNGLARFEEPRLKFYHHNKCYRKYGKRIYRQTVNFN